jgi:serine/threonine-protein kinase
MYMAPEQLRGEAFDARCDQFAWGVLAYELLTGRRPWGGTGVALVAKIVTAELPPLRAEAGASRLASLEVTLRRATEKAPADRFPSMDAVVDALARGDGEEHGIARRRATLASVASLLAMSVALAMLAWRARPPTAAQAEAVVQDAPPSASTLVAASASAVEAAAPHETADAGVSTGAPPQMAAPRKGSSSRGPSGAAEPARPGAAAASAAARCDPPFFWRSGLKVPKPECLD